MSKTSSELAEQRIGFLGAGAMAEALAGGLAAAGVDAQRIRAADPDPVRRERLQEKLGIATCAGPKLRRPPRPRPRSPPLRTNRIRPP